MSRFDGAIALAKRLIKKNGQLVNWQIAKDGAPADSLKPWIASESPDVTKPVYICFVPIKDKETRKLIQALKGTEVPGGNLAGLMAPTSGLTPSLKDVVIRSGKVLRIVSIDSIAPNEQTVLWILEFAE